MKTFSTRLSGKDKIALVSNLGTMLAAGIPILESVDSLLEESKGNYKKILEVLRDDLKAGNHVFASFAKFPNVFNKVTVNLIKASEEAGTLETTLKDIKQNIQEEMEFSDKVKSAMTYPTFVLAVFIGVFMMILLFVVPKVSQVFSRLNVPLPLPTQVMLAASDFMVKNYPYLIVGAIIVGILGYLLYQRQRQILFSILFAMPVVSQLVKEIDLTRFARSLGLLLNAGLPIATALELAQDVVVKKEVADLIKKSREMVISGKDFSEGLRRKKGIFPTMTIKLIEVGEKSGTLAKSMQDISVGLDYQVTKSLKSATTLLEPIMLVFVGLGVGGMMMAIIAPIYGLIGQVGN
jgi:type IV pilus assembly protein PilC